MVDRQSICKFSAFVLVVAGVALAEGSRTAIVGDDSSGAIRRALLDTLRITSMRIAVVGALEIARIRRC